MPGGLISQASLCKPGNTSPRRYTYSIFGFNKGIIDRHNMDVTMLNSGKFWVSALLFPVDKDGGEQGDTNALRKTWGRWLSDCFPVLRGEELTILPIRPKPLIPTWFCQLDGHLEAWQEPTFVSPPIVLFKDFVRRKSYSQLL